MTDAGAYVVLMLLGAIFILTALGLLAGAFTMFRRAVRQRRIERRRGA